MMVIAINIFCSVMEMATLWYLGSFIMGKSKYRWPVNVLVLLLAVAASVCAAVFMPKGPVRILVNAAIFLVPLLLFESSLLMKLFTLGLFVTISGCTEQAVKALQVLINGGLEAVDGDFGKYVQGAVLSKFLALALVRLLMSFKKAKGQTLSGLAMLEMVIYPLTTMLVMSQILRPGYFVEDTSTYVGAFLVACALIVTNFLLFHIFERQAEQENNKIKLALMQKQQEEQKRFYLELAAEKKKTNQMAHDIKNYLLAVSGFIQEGRMEDALAYLQQLQVLSETNYCHITGHLPIDAVLAEKEHQAELQGTTLRIETTIDHPLQADEVDVALLLANALDNALEATIDLPEAVITLIYRVDEYYIDLILTNTVAHEVIVENNSIATNKADNEHHGIGLASIKEIVERYDGSIELSSDGQMFTLDVLLGNVSADSAM